jgi:toxin ParE1/3/4
MKAIRFTTEANLDIEEISGYLFDLNPVAADRFLDALNDACELLAEHPLIGRQRPTLGDALRSFPIGNYIIFYLPTQNEIYIVRVLYGGRDLPRVFQK